MIEVVGLTQHYGVRPVLIDVSVTFPKGQVTVVVGPNGMGKSTLLAATGGVLSPQKGHVSVAGFTRRSTPDAELAARRAAFYLPDEPYLSPTSTPREFLLAVGRLYKVDPERTFAAIASLADLFDLTNHLDSGSRSLSAGQKKKVSLCSALVSETPILLLDEPFSGGLDPGGILVLKKLLKRKAADGGTVVLTSPVPEIVEEIADRVVVLKDGRVAADDTLDGLRRGGESLAAVLERLLYPDAARKVDAYLGGRTS